MKLGRTLTRGQSPEREEALRCRLVALTELGAQSGGSSMARGPRKQQELAMWQASLGEAWADRRPRRGLSGTRLAQTQRGRVLLSPRTGVSVRLRPQGTQRQLQKEESLVAGRESTRKYREMYAGEANDLTLRREGGGRVRQAGEGGVHALAGCRLGDRPSLMGRWGEHLAGSPSSGRMGCPGCRLCAGPRGRRDRQSEGSRTAHRCKENKQRRKETGDWSWKMDRNRRTHRGRQAPKAGHKAGRQRRWGRESCRSEEGKTSKPQDTHVRASEAFAVGFKMAADVRPQA